MKVEKKETKTVEVVLTLTEEQARLLRIITNAVGIDSEEQKLYLAHGFVAAKDVGKAKTLSDKIYEALLNLD